MMITAKKIQIEDELEDEDSINEQESKERIEKIKEKEFYSRIRTRIIILRY